MSKSGKRESIIKYKLLYTAIILLVYMLGRSLPIYGIDMAAYTGKAMDAGELLEQTISGDRHSLFALGISPYMIASILVQMVTALRRAGSKEKISPLRTNRVMLALTFTFAVFQAATQVQELPFRPMWLPIELVKLVAAAELVAGVAMILWLSARNKKYGIGGQTALIYINIMDGILTNLTRHELRELAAPLCVAVAALIIMNVMESGEKRIPVQRISIHNIYSDKNYLAIKLNPVGVMPVMFATAFLMLPRFLLTGLGYLFPESAGILWWQENLEMDRPLGGGRLSPDPVSADHGLRPDLHQSGGDGGAAAEERRQPAGHPCGAGDEEVPVQGGAQAQLPQRHGDEPVPVRAHAAAATGCRADIGHVSCLGHDAYGHMVQPEGGIRGGEGL